MFRAEEINMMLRLVSKMCACTGLEKNVKVIILMDKPKLVKTGVTLPRGCG